MSYGVFVRAMCAWVWVMMVRGEVTVRRRLESWGKNLVCTKRFYKMEVRPSTDAKSKD